MLADNVDAAATNRASALPPLRILASALAAGAIYYLATRAAWVMTFPGSKVSLFFPPPGILVSILLLTPTRHWWAYLLAAASSHFVATQQEQWPLSYALQCEAFDIDHVDGRRDTLARQITVPSAQSSRSDLLRLIAVVIDDERRRKRALPLAKPA